MHLEVSSIDGGNLLKNINAFKCSDEPPYLAIMIRPSPGIWENLMDQNFLFIKKDKSYLNVSIKQRIEVGDSSIFFVTSESKEFLSLLEE